MDEYETELKVTLDELIEFKKFNAAIRVLRTVKPTFTQHDLYLKRVTDLMVAQKPQVKT